MNWWAFLNTPDNFRRNWYGELTNQISHTMLGLVATVLALSVWREVAGEMPVRSWVFLGIFLPYAILIEGIAQKWKPGDAWFDSLMFGSGCAAALLPFHERSVQGHKTLILYDHRAMLGIAAFWALCLLLRVARRYAASKRQV